MKNNKISLNVFLISSFLALTLNGCSDDEPSKTSTTSKTQTTKKAPHNPFDHSHDEVVTDIEKHEFEHQFAQQCIAREVKNSNNKANDRKRFSKPCMCIAKEMLADLTAVEAEKFLKERKSTQSLKIRFESAAYECLQEKQPPQAPQIFNRR